MDAVAINALCVVLPRKSGSKLVMPAGFATGGKYKVLSIFMPNGSSDLHVNVVGERGMIYPMRADAVEIIEVASFERCIVLPRKSGAREVIPAGFKISTVYPVLLQFFPNGTTDLHLAVIGENGLVSPLKATDVKMTADRRLLWSFLTPSDTWTIATGALHLGWAETCLDLAGRKMLPHRVTWDATYEHVIINWTRPVAGHFLLG